MPDLVNLFYVCDLAQIPGVSAIVAFIDVCRWGYWTAKFLGFIQKSCCHNLQSNSVITNSTGPPIFVRYSREFVITVIVITEFDCIYTSIFVVIKLVGPTKVGIIKLKCTVLNRMWQHDFMMKQIFFKFDIFVRKHRLTGQAGWLPGSRFLTHTVSTMNNLERLPRKHSSEQLQPS